MNEWINWEIDVNGFPLDGLMGEHSYAFSSRIQLSQFAVSAAECWNVLEGQVCLFFHQPAVHDEPLGGAVATLTVKRVRVKSHRGTHVQQLPNVRQIVVVLVDDGAAIGEVLRHEQRHGAAHGDDVLVQDAHQRPVLADEMLHHARALHELYWATPGNNKHEPKVFVFGASGFFGNQWQI